VLAEVSARPSRICAPPFQVYGETLGKRLRKGHHGENSTGTWSGNRGDTKAWTPVALAGLLAYFTSKALYFAFHINAAIFPDEVTWVGISEIFSSSLLPPADSPESHQFGLITHTPILYFFVMGRFLNMNFLPLSDLMFLRCMNVCLMVVTIWYGWKLSGLLNLATVARVLSIALLTNTMMFTFMAAAVSYDNLTTLFAVLSLYFLVFFLQQGRQHHFLLASAALLLGCLTKYTLIPYALLLVLVTLHHQWRNLSRIPAALVGIFSSRRAVDLVLAVVCLLVLGANLRLYLGNWLEFGRLIPRADQVLTTDQALRFRLFARSHIVAQFKRGEVSLEEARKMVLEHVQHEGDRDDAFRLLERAARDKADKRPHQRLDRFRYAFVWIDVMANRLYGVAAHRLLPRVGYELVPYHLIIMVAVLMMIRTFSPGDMQGMAPYLFFIVGGYVLILMQVQNYGSYRYSGTPHLAITGRYLFPVIAPGYVLLSHYLLNSSRKWWVWGAGGATAAFFIYGEFPWFLQRASRAWFF